MYVTRKQSLRGFFALISITVVSLVLLFAAVALSASELSGRMALLSVDGKMRSEGYANACVEYARVFVTNDASYRSAQYQRFQVGSGTCTILSVTPDMPGAGESLIRASAEESGAVTNVVAIIYSTTGDLISFREVGTF